MIDWLSEWIRNIIAVILFAVFIELLLPNQKMLRYARLLVGLFVLLAIMSPLFQIFQKDVYTQLEAGMQLWDKELNKHEVSLPTIEEIQTKAQQLRDQRNQDSLAVTETAIKQNMQQDIEEQFQVKIAKLDLIMEWKQYANGDLLPNIEQVFVKLQETAETPASTDAVHIESVESVFIEVEPIESTERAVSGQSTGQEEKNVDQKLAEQIQFLISRGWNIERSKVHIY